MQEQTIDISSNELIAARMSITSEEEHSKLKGTISELISNRVFLINTILMGFLWAVSSFNYYLVGFLVKHLPGDVFVNSIVMSVVEVPT